MNESTLNAVRLKNFLTVPEARHDVFQDMVDERTLRGAIANGTIPAIKLGTKTLIPVPQLLALVEGQSRPVLAPCSPSVNADAVRTALDMIAAGVAALRSLVDAQENGASATVTQLPDLGGDHAIAG